MPMCEVKLVLLLLLMVSGATAAASAPQQYFCIENYKPLGDALRNVPLSNASSAAQLTAGHTARRCSAACDAEQQRCSAFWAVGADAVGGPSCQLLANTTARLARDLVLPQGADWAPVLSNVMPVDGLPLRSLAWLCIKGSDAWDAFGAATHALINTRVADPSWSGNTGPGQQWCAMGTDVAGTNLQQITTIKHPADCDQLCANAGPSCSIWTFAAASPTSNAGQAPLNCFIKADPMRGQNGWTGPPKADIWQPDSQMDCLKEMQDWRQLGLMLSPAIQTVSLNGLYFTVFPERVPWDQAAAACSALPGGELAILDSRTALDTAHRSLLNTLASQTAVRSAWVGAAGNNTAYNPAAAAGAAAPAGSTQVPQQANVSQLGPDVTLTWLNGCKVDPSQLRRLTPLPDLWNAHDVIWTQQFVPVTERRVCGRLLVESPPPQQPLTDPSSVLPGVWYFDCQKPAGFICQSTSPPDEPMTGRSNVLEPRNSTNATQSGWSDATPSTAVWKIALATLLPSLAVLLLAWQWVAFKTSRAARRLPDLLWQQKKRLAGPPRSGRVSVVVTDIQDYTRLTAEAPHGMVQALLLHNQVIQQAAYNHVGYVLQQEGDSFSLAFHEPQDAVEFALQVQLALQEQSWPQSITYPPEPWLLQAGATADPAATPSTSTSTAQQNTNAPGSDGWQQQQQRRHSMGGIGSPSSARQLPRQLSHRASWDAGLMRWLSGSLINPPADPQLTTADAETVPRQRDAAPDGPSSSQQNSYSSSRSPSNLDSRQGGLSQQLGSPNGASQQQQAPAAAAASSGAADAAPGAMGLSQSPTDTAATNSSWWRRRHSSGRAGAGRHSEESDWFRSSNSYMFGPVGSWLDPPPSFGAQSPFSTTSTGATRSRNAWLQQLLWPAKGAGAAGRQQQQDAQGQQPQLFSGLRVRMGVASGVVRKGQPVRQSPVYRMAQDVSSAAAGGQVLLDAPTFAAVKESMRRLGLVTAAGLDYEALYSSHGHSNLPGSGSSADGVSSILDCSWCHWPTVLLPPQLRLGSSTIRRPQAPPGAQSAVAFDMGSYIVSTNPAFTRGATSSTILLWGEEEGNRLVQAYQQYLQQQLLQQPYGLASSQQDSFSVLTGVEPAAALGATRAAEVPEQPYMLAAYLRSLSEVGTADSGQIRQQHLPLTGNSGSGAAADPPSPPPLQQRQHRQDSQQGQQHEQRHHQLQHALQHQDFNSYSVSSSSGSMSHNKGRASLVALRGRLLGLGGRLVGIGRFGAAGVGKEELPWDLPRDSQPGSPTTLATGASGDWPHHTIIPMSSLKRLTVSRPAPGLAKTTVSTAAAAAATPAAAAATPAPCRIRLYQIVAPTLAGRAAVFGARLAVPDGWNCIDPPYFSAPGLSTCCRLAAQAQAASAAPSAAAAAAALPGAAAGSSQPLLPPSTAPLSPQASAVLITAPLTPQTSTTPLSPEMSTVLVLDAAAAAAAEATSDRTTKDQAQHSSLFQSPFAAAGASALLAAASPAVPASPEAATAATAAAAAAAARGNQLQQVQQPSSSSLVLQRPVLPSVTIVFTVVDGAQQLAELPELSRALHKVLNHLLLTLLSCHFPGSYLVRAQEAELRYLAAFNTPTAAASWCLLVQEAALYAPYPNELLGVPGFGVQLDASSRLVFRGPRLKAGFSEGVPGCILPDHAGRADFSGAFVNRAARYADAAAHGGSIVTDAELASRVLQHWQQQWRERQQLMQQQQQSLQQGLPSAGVSLPDQNADNSAAQQLLGSGGSSSNDPPTGANRAATTNPSDRWIGPAPVAATAEITSGADAPSTVPAPGTTQVPCGTGGFSGSNADVAAGKVGLVPVPVEARLLGSFLFKGSHRPVEMVRLLPVALAGRSFPEGSPAGKGLRVAQRVGLLGRGSVLLPAALDEAGFGQL